MKSLRECRICNKSDLTIAIDLGNMAMSGIFPGPDDDDPTSGPVVLVKCEDCKLLQLGHTYPLDQMYGKQYGYHSSLSPSMVRHLKEIVRGLQVKADLKPGDTVLDIGSNDGTLLNQYPPDLSRIGIDPTAGNWRDHYHEDIRVIEDFFPLTTPLHIDGEIKLITSIAMFYDLPEPNSFVKEVRRLLHPEGLWYTEQAYLPRILANTAYDVICHEHLEYYTIKDIHRLAEHHGLFITDLTFNNVNGGSFGVTLAKEGSKHKSLDLTLMLDHEARQTSDAALSDFYRNILCSRMDLWRKFREVRGRVMLGYGASTKGNILLQYCHLNPMILPAIVDINPAKKGCRTPGTGIPIITPEEAKDFGPDIYFVLPWHFREHFLQKEQDFLKNGGSFLFPLPRVELVNG